MALDNTVGGASADSYCSEAEADAYYGSDAHLWSSVWTAATTPQKEAALKTATRLLDDLVDWKGAKLASTQALRWPREGVYDRDGNLLATDAIPTFLIRATAEFSRFLLSSDRTAESDTLGISALKVGPVALDFDKRDRQQIIPDIIKKMVEKYGALNQRNSTISLLRG